MQAHYVAGQNPPPYAPPYDEKVANPNPPSDFADVPQELRADILLAQKEIAKYGLQNHEARVCVALDVTRSMQNPNGFYDDPKKGNQVQTLINKALALAFLFDDNHQIEIIPFGDKAYPPVIINVNNYTSATKLVLNSIGGDLKPTTSYAAAVRAVRQHYFGEEGQRNRMLKTNKPPVFTIFITDGEPNIEKIEARNQFLSSTFSAIFFKFIALKGKQEDQKFTYLKSLDDDHDGSLVDNCDLVLLNQPEELTMAHLINEYRPWLSEIHAKGMLGNHPGIKLMKTGLEGRVVKSRGLFACCQTVEEEDEQKQESPRPR